uniref:Putative 39s ribosomal protein n=1 Tax=Amblyomma cajennense TaxID=34607 RepID=A0A023FJ67_AMBCJ
MSSTKKFVPIFERFPAHYRRFLEDMKRKPAPVHYKPPPEKYVWNPRLKKVFRTEERPIPVLYPKECREGIWGGEGIVRGYKPCATGYYVKYFQPILRRVVLYSEILDKYMRVTVTQRTQLLINEHYGFDFYILKTPVQDLHSQLALDLRRKMLLALARKDLYHNDEKKQKEILEKYKDFIVSEEEADWFGLTLWKAEAKLMDYEDALPKPKPLKYQFLNDYLEELKLKEEAKQQEEATTEQSQSWASRLNPFRRSSPSSDSSGSQPSS